MGAAAAMRKTGEIDLVKNVTFYGAVQDCLSMNSKLFEPRHITHWSVFEQLLHRYSIGRYSAWVGVTNRDQKWVYLSSGKDLQIDDSELSEPREYAIPRVSGMIDGTDCMVISPKRKYGKLYHSPCDYKEDSYICEYSL